MRNNHTYLPIADAGGYALRRRVLEEITKLQACLRNDPNRFTPEGLVALNEVLMTLNDIIPHTAPLPTLFGPSHRTEYPECMAAMQKCLEVFQTRMTPIPDEILREKDSNSSPENTP